MKNSFVVVFLMLFVSNIYSSRDSFSSNFSDNEDVMCTLPPNLFCPMNFFGCLGSDTDPSNTGIATASPPNTNCPTPEVSYVDEIAAEGPCVGQMLIERIWSATYPDNTDPDLISTCSQFVLLTDKERPILTGCPDDILVSQPDNCDLQVFWTEPLASDECAVVSFISNYSSGDFFPIGTTIVNYTAIDGCGNEATCSFSVTVDGTCCDTPPIVTCPDNFSSDCPAEACNSCLADEITTGIMGISNELKVVYRYYPGRNQTDSIHLQGINSDLFNIGVNQDDKDEYYFITNGNLYQGDYSVNSLVLIGETGISAQVNGLDYTDDDRLVAITGGGQGEVYQVSSTNSESTLLFDTDIPDPRDISYDSNSETYWIAIGGGFLQYDSSGNLIQELSIPPPYGRGLLFDGSCGIIYYISNDNVFKYDIATTETTFLYSIWDVELTNNDIDGFNITSPLSIEYHVNTNCETGEIISIVDEDGNPYIPAGCSSLQSACQDDFSLTIDPSVTGMATSEAGEDDCDDPILTYEDEIISEGPCDGTFVIERSWIATDPNFSELADTCVQVIEYGDNDAPTIDNCPSDITVDAIGGCETEATWTSPTTTDECGMASLTSTHNSGDVFPSGETIVTYTATDECGNISTCSFSITVNPDGPEINCPADYEACVNSSTEPSTTGEATATSGINCPAPTITHNDDVISLGNCGDVIIERTWIATDDNGLTAICTQTITLSDNEPPSITCPDDITVQAVDACESAVTWSDVITSDNCSNVSVLSTYNSGDIFPAGTTVVMVTAADECGNSNDCSFSVTVLPVGPSIICPQDFTGCTGSSIDTSVTGIASGNASTNCSTPSITYDDNVISEGTCGDKVVERTWTATDANGLTATCGQNITLIDETSPVVTCPTNITVSATGACEAIADWPTPDATDNCSSVTLASSHNSGDIFSEGETTVTITATDACGNASSCTFTVTVNPDGPRISCPIDYSTCPGESIDPSITGTASGMSGTNCPNPTVTYNDEISSQGTCGDMVIERTWTATDDNGNSISCVQLISLDDNESPSITGLSDITVSNECDRVAIWSDPQVDDNCGLMNVTTTQSSGSEFPIGNTEVTYTAIDNCGNSSQQSFTVTIIDVCCDTPPNITCPDDFTSDCTITNCGTCSIDEISTGLIGISNDLKAVFKYYPGRNETDSIHLSGITTDLFNIGVNPDNMDEFYFITDGNLYIGDYSNKSYSLIGDTGLAGSINGLDYAPDGRLVAIRGSGFGDVYDISKDSGEATLIFDTDLTDPRDISFDLTNQSYWIAIAGGFSEYDVMGNLLQNISVSEPYGRGLTFVNSCNLIYYISNDQVYMHDVVSGESTFLYSIWDVELTNNDIDGFNLTSPLSISYTTTFDCLTGEIIEILDENGDPYIPAGCTSLNANCNFDTDDPIDPSTTGMATAVAGEVDCEDPILSYEDEIISEGPCDGAFVIERSWIATDPNYSTLADTCIQVIEYGDDTPPTLDNCPSDLTVDAVDACEAPAIWNDPSASDACDDVIISSTHESGDIFLQGNTIVTYTATDDCGNTTTCSFTVTVNPDGPQITCPPDFEDCIGANIDPSVTGQATATGGTNCPIPNITFNDKILSQGSCGNMVIERTWTATDDNGLSASCVQLITLDDNEAPDVTCPADITIQAIGACEAIAEWNDPMAVDACTSVTITTSHTSGDLFTSGVTTITVVATDDCGNSSDCTFTVTVIPDDPSISCPTDYEGCPGTSINPVITGNPTATSGTTCPVPSVDFTDVVVSEGTCDDIVIERTWTATDDNGLSATCVQIITLTDDSDPNIECPVDITISGQPDCSVIVEWDDPVSLDNCEIASTNSSHNSGDFFELGVTTVTYTVLDNCGNSAQCSFTVTIENDPPALVCPDDYVGCPGDDIETSTLGEAYALVGVGCEEPDIDLKEEIISEGPCEGQLNLKRVWTMSINGVVIDQCLQIIVLKDDEAPSISCPSDITVNALGSCDAIVTWVEPIASDNCGIASITSTHNSGDTFVEGITTVTYTVEDNCSHTATCSIDITVVAGGVTIHCPDDYKGCPSSSIEPAIIGTATASVGSSCPQPTISFNDNIISQGNCGDKVIERTWTAEDAFGNIDECTQLITLEDVEDPSITCPVDITVNAMGGCEANATWTEPISDDNCGIASVTSSHNSGDSFSEGTTTVTYIAEDNCGNTATCSFDVTVIAGGVTIACPPDVYACPGSDIDPISTGTASASVGSSCPQPVITFIDNIVAQGPCGHMIIQRTWTATDGFGNTDECDQTITLEDNTEPTISCPSDITMNASGGCEVNVTWTEPDVFDNCEVASVVSSHNSGDSFSEGVTTVDYTVEDNCGNTATCSFDVTVIAGGVSITCPDDYTSCPGSDINPSTTGTATASVGSNCPQPNITFDDFIVSQGSCGDLVIERTWTATDGFGNSDDCIQVITLKDNEVPTISCPADITMNIVGTCETEVTWTEPTTNDNCGISSVISTNDSGDVFAEGITSVTYVVEDNCGNTASCSFEVTVIVTSTSLTCPADYTGCPGDDIDPSTIGTAAITGSNCNNASIDYSNHIVSEGSCGDKLIERTWLLVSNGNILESCVQIISLQDNEAPVISGCPDDVTILWPGSVNWTPPTVDDNCSVPTLLSNYETDHVFTDGITTVIYTAEDDCGNQSQCSFTITVESSLDLDCPDDIVVECQDPEGTYVSWPTPTATSDCDNCANPANIQGFIYMGNLNGHHYYCSSQPATWEDANINAEANGGYLAVINSAEENSFLANALTMQSAFIGLHDSHVEGDFEWVNGDNLTYENWYPGQPNDYNNNQDFVEFLNNGQWNDQYPTASLEYIMEIPCIEIFQTAGPSNGSLFPVGTTDVSYMTIDPCGHKDSCTFSVTVLEGLHITCPDDLDIFTNNSCQNVTWDLPDVSSCCGDYCGNGEAIEGFIYMGQLNGHHYYCSNTKDTWLNGQAVAVSYGGYLACIGSAEENYFLSDFISVPSAFIGLSDHVTEGEFAWDCGEPLSYSNWYNDQPNDYMDSQDFVELLSNGQWNDQNNDEELEYIMEIPSCINMEQTGGPAPGSCLAAGSSYEVTYEASDICGNIETCSFMVNVYGGSCVTGGLSTEFAYIDDVDFNAIHNQSGDNDGYADFTNICTTVKAGSTYYLTLKPGFSTPNSYHVYWKIWVDWNQDGDFEDYNEILAYGNGQGIVSGLVHLPANVYNGSTTMRITMKKGSYPTSPCEVYEHGETEDYCLNVVGDVSFKSVELVQNRNEHKGSVLTPDLLAANNIQVHPNPARDFINIDLKNIIYNGTLEVLNSTGSLMMKQRLVDTTHEIVDVSLMTSGFYCIRVYNEEGFASTKKIVIQR